MRQAEGELVGLSELLEDWDQTLGLDASLSAWIDGDGRILRQGHRRDTDLLLDIARNPDLSKLLWEKSERWRQYWSAIFIATSTATAGPVGS